jgi:hypothetical protein
MHFSSKNKENTHSLQQQQQKGEDGKGAMMVPF